MGKPIVICGFMGSGKTTVGRLLAKRLIGKFIDTDEMIEQTQKMSIPNIFQEKGEEYFRALEHVTLQNALKSLGPITPVIAVGGGTLMDPDNVALLKEYECHVVYLSTDFDICYERIKSSNRPLVMKNTREQLKALYDQRHEVYAGLCNTQLYNHGAPERTVNNIISLINPLSIQKL